MAHPTFARSDRQPASRERKRAAVETIIGIDPVDRTIGHFLPILMADRLRRDHDGAVRVARSMMNVRKSANFAIMHPAPLDKFEWPTQSAAGHFMPIGDQQIETELRRRIDIAAPVGDSLYQLCEGIQYRPPGFAFLHHAQQLEHVLAVRIPVDGGAAGVGKFGQQQGAHPVKIGNRSIVNQRPAAIHEWVRISQRWFANRSPADMRQHLPRINAPGRPPEMLAMISRPCLPFNVCGGAVKRDHAPAVGMGCAGPVRLALHHKRVLRMHQRAFNLGRLGGAKPVQSTHARIIARCAASPYPQCSGGRR